MTFFTRAHTGSFVVVGQHVEPTPLHFLISVMLFAAFVPGLSTELRQVIVVQAAMPAGIMPIVLARHYAGDSGVAIRIVLGTTLASVLTMPLWIHAGIAWVL